MNQKEMIKNVRDDLGAMDMVFSQKEIKAVIDVFFNNLRNVLINKDSYTVNNFGKFATKTAKEHTWKSPRNGETVVIPEKTLPKFKFSQVFKKDVSNN